MTVHNFFPAIKSINLFTKRNSSELFLMPGKENHLYLSCEVGGLLKRTIPLIHDMPDYVALYFTLLHQFGGKETLIVRRYVVEYDPESIEKDNDIIELSIPIDDDFSEINFTSNYYYLQISFTHKHPGEMGIGESLNLGKIFETKIPFQVLNEEVV